MGAAKVSGLLLTGSHLQIMSRALDALDRERRRNGLPASKDAADMRALLAPSGHAASPPPAAPQDDCMSTEEAAQALGVSVRTARRMAPKLGGRRVGGALLFDRIAVQEHLSGKHNFEEEL